MNRRSFFRRTAGVLLAPFVPWRKLFAPVAWPPMRITPEMSKALTASMKGFFNPTREVAEAYWNGRPVALLGFQMRQYNSAQDMANEQIRARPQAPYVVSASDNIWAPHQFLHKTWEEMGGTEADLRAAVQALADAIDREIVRQVYRFNSTQDERFLRGRQWDPPKTTSETALLQTGVTNRPISRYVVPVDDQIVVRGGQVLVGKVVNGETAHG